VKVLIAGGGTGGHLFPGLAVADELRARGGEVVFVGTQRGIETRVVPAAGYRLELLSVSGLARMGVVNTLRGLGRLPGAFAQAFRILRGFAPDVVLGVGGYASGPVGMVAALGGWPLALQEQNSVPGFTNRTLGRFAREIFLAFEDARAAFPGDRCHVTGNPVRANFLTAAAAHAGIRTSSDGKGRVLIVGGSQGARAVNELVVAAMQFNTGRGFNVVHQCGAAEVEKVTDAYRRTAVASFEVVPFIEDMAGAYAEADVVVARSGALTLAELAVMGRPAILIPLPTAADDHQTKNAAAFERAGAAIVLAQADAKPEILAAKLAALMEAPDRRARMAAAMQSLARPDAARLVADRLEEIGDVERA
jgi:UDP-N-acetylglucosamine--N-acetylmuramyl-(pentapeptide) pyrophosphoryl-undecaprenol N-acetylglucosamine transferase